MTTTTAKLGADRPAFDAVGAFILAGGESSRMGRDKGLLEIDGIPMLVRTTRLVEATAGRATIVGEAESYERLGLRMIRDDWEHAGPLGAIGTALRATDRAWNLIVACDLPYLTREWLEFLIGRALESDADALLPMNDRGAEPLCGMYAKSCEAAVWLALDRGVRKVTEGLSHLRVEYMEPSEWKVFDPDGLLFKNMNSPADYEEATRKLEIKA
ncbi:MAG: molybdenum cofactor guanylyltransferase [Candidatus Acidiferrales bacterium]